MKNNNIIVIGGGIIGLTTALNLLENKYKVIVISEKYALGYLDIVSQVAGALWEIPPAVCGSHNDDENDNIEYLTKLAINSYKKFKEIYNRYGYESTGIREHNAYYFFKDKIKIDKTDKEYVKRKNIKEFINKYSDMRDFEKDFDEVKKDLHLNKIEIKDEYKDGYRYKSFVIDTNKYLNWLMEKIKNEGGILLNGKIENFDKDTFEKLKNKYNSDIIINCTGFASKEIDDKLEIKDKYKMKALRGFLIHIENNINLVDCLLVSKKDDKHEGSNYEKYGFTFIIPKNENTIVLGGYAEFKESIDLNDNNNNKIVQDMKKSCLEFLPLLNIRYKQKGIYAGIRPYRYKPRIEIERINEELYLIHNYGHGGSGYTLSWGCANEVKDLVNNIIYRITH
jgi:D-amino-acid oxidase